MMGKRARAEQDIALNLLLKSFRPLESNSLLWYFSFQSLAASLSVFHFKSKLLDGWIQIQLILIFETFSCMQFLAACESMGQHGKPKVTGREDHAKYFATDLHGHTHVAQAGHAGITCIFLEIRMYFSKQQNVFVWRSCSTNFELLGKHLMDSCIALVLHFFHLQTPLEYNCQVIENRFSVAGNGV